MGEDESQAWPEKVGGEIESQEETNHRAGVGGLCTFMGILWTAWKCLTPSSQFPL
jgi:hypothetical protein